MLIFVCFSGVTAYTSALKTSIKSQTEFQTKLMASPTISSVKTDEIFTNLLIQHGENPFSALMWAERNAFVSTVK